MSDDEQEGLSLETLQVELFKLSHSQHELEGSQLDFQRKTSEVLQRLSSTMNELIGKLNLKGEVKTLSDSTPLAPVSASDIQQVNEPNAGPAEPSKEARQAFMAMSGKPLGEQLSSTTNFASWNFQLQCALQLVNLHDHIMKGAAEPVWLHRYPELSKGAYLIIVRSLAPSQASLIHNTGSNPAKVYDYLFKHNLGSSASMRDSRAAELRSIRLTNKEKFVNYAEMITSRASELHLLGDQSFNESEKKRILLAGMQDAPNTNGFTMITSLVYAMGINDYKQVVDFVSEALKRTPTQFQLAHQAKHAYTMERAYSSNASRGSSTRGRGGRGGRGRGNGRGTPTQRQKNICFAYRDHGECKRTNCKYRHEDDPEKQQKSNIATTTTEEEFAFNTSSIEKHQWTFDSGATSHMSCDESDFVTRVSTDKIICSAFGQKKKAGFIGTARIDIDGKIGPRKVTVKDALFSRDMKAKLLSIPALDKQGLATLFFGGKAIVMDKSGKVIMTGSLQQDQYLLDKILSTDAENTLQQLVEGMSTLFR